MTEAQIEARMVRMIQDRGGLCLKFTSPGNPGVPDRIVVLPGGRVIFVELKTEIGRMANIQKWQRGRLQERSADVRTLYGWPQVKQFVEEVMPI